MLHTSLSVFLDRCSWLRAQTAFSERIPSAPFCAPQTMTKDSYRRKRRSKGFRGKLRLSALDLLAAIHEAGPPVAAPLGGAGAPAGAAAVVAAAQAADDSQYVMTVEEASGLLMSTDVPDMCEPKDRFRYSTLTAMYTLINCHAAANLKEAAKMVVATDNFQRTYRQVCFSKNGLGSQRPSSTPPPPPPTPAPGPSSPFSAALVLINDVAVVGMCCAAETQQG